MIRILFFGSLCLFIFACNTSENGTFSEPDLFATQGSLFRGFNPGVAMDSIEAYEKGKLIFKDECGLVYEVIREKEIRIRIQYFNSCPPVSRPLLLEGILVTYTLPEEFETVKYLEGMEKKLRNRFGVGEGAFGKWEWSVPEHKVKAALTLSIDRRNIILNFYKK